MASSRIRRRWWAVFHGSVAKDRRYQWWSASDMSARYCAMRTGRLTAGRVVPSRVCRMPRRPSGPVTTVVPVGLAVWERRVLPSDCHGARSRVHPKLMRILAPPCPTDDDSSRAAWFRQTGLSHEGRQESHGHAASTPASSCQRSDVVLATTSFQENGFNMPVTDAEIKTLVEYCETHLGDSNLWTTPDGYPNSLALCIIDSIYSTGSHYSSVVNVIEHYKASGGARDGAKDLARSIQNAGGAREWATSIAHNLKPAHTRPG